jgi:hypothetical protein
MKTWLPVQCSFEACYAATAPGETTSGVMLSNIVFHGTALSLGVR